MTYLAGLLCLLGMWLIGCRLPAPEVPPSAPAQSAVAEPRWYVARVVDGDTLVLLPAAGPQLQVRVRLWGVDCPEAAAPRGPEATAFTRAFCEGRPVELTLHGHDRYQRTLAEVRVGGADLAAALLAAGHAVPYRK